MGVSDHRREIGHGFLRAHEDKCYQDGYIAGLRAAREAVEGSASEGSPQQFVWGHCQQAIDHLIKKEGEGE